ncbi:prolyl oligopeptidase family serine peptidase [Alteribacter populi]|uniref:prolyl oligopeptidase family serine peptidase n=1 Tax=Alteribacter populi TaxID=2011011 RepID=UPI000BBAD45A|nr:prolyl oligopeptidase family serine peptidase [Alteribacter populi]
MTTVKKSKVAEDFHGTIVEDPYRWLEDPESEETKMWGEHWKNQCDLYFSKSQSQTQDKERLTELWNYSKFFVPKKVNDRLFYQKNIGLQNQAVLYMNKDGQEEVILDPNYLSEDGTVAMTNYSFSRNGRYIAYSTSVHGSDWQEIHVRDIDKSTDLADVIEWVRFTPLAWAPDHSGFFYSRFPETCTVKKEDEANFNRVYFHKLGTSQTEDELIHEQPEDKELLFAPSVTEDEQFLILHVRFGTAAQNRFYVKPLHSSVPFTRLLDEQDAEYNYITNEGNTFYFQTDLDAPKKRVVAINLNAPEKTSWKEIIAETDDTIDEVVCVNGKFVVAYLKDAHHKLTIYDLKGYRQRDIGLPIIGSLTNITGGKEDEDMYFGLTSYLNPTVVYKYNFNNGRLDVFAGSSLSVDTNQFVTEQVFYPSKDGTKVPMFITHRKGIELNGKNRVILYGYGGFTVSQTPAFNPSILRWLEKGGVYAVANLRGGAEYGEEWHKAGMLENKQNVFDDFIAAGEWLIKREYTESSKLSIMGGSNGGLLVAACMVQRPDLFGAVVCRVPVIDMLRYHKFTIGRYWMPEYGDPEKADHFPFLYRYSPLHNVKEGATYPPVLIATAESDDRVVPAHAKKFAATLNEKASADSKVVLRLESKAGHGLGKPTSKLIDEWVDFYSFLERELH